LLRRLVRSGRIAGGRLDGLNRWRNAIAHQDFDPAQLGGRVEIRLEDVRRWRANCNALTQQFDWAVGSYVAYKLREARRPRVEIVGAEGESPYFERITADDV